MDNLVEDFKHVIQGCSIKEDILELSISFIKYRLEVDSVAIRLQEGYDFPYYTTLGFSEAFIREENFLCARSKDKKPILNNNGIPHLECMCGKVIEGKLGTHLPFCSAIGSAIIQDTSGLIASGLLKEFDDIRATCNAYGYETVILVPIRYKEQGIGLLQINDRRKNAVAQEYIPQIETIASIIGPSLGPIVEKEATRQMQKKDIKDNIKNIANELLKSLEEKKEKFTNGHGNKKSK